MQDNVTQAVDWTSRAESIVNSSDAIRMYASCEWEELSQDGQLWMAQIVRLASTTAQTEAVQKLVEALEFYADKDGDGYEAYPTDYGLSMDRGDIIKDGGERARQALAAHRESQP